MRVSRLAIPAYGPFTGFELNLPGAGTDLHIIHGPNEAGKSSLLRAFRALLFGIPAQTTDNFLHEYGRMRIAADLELSDGRVKTFQRRKGKKNTLLDAGDQPIAEFELQSCLGGVDEMYFDSMFGLDGERLRAGADALLQGQGRLGEALFSASMGGTPVDMVIRNLEAEAAEIFSGRAQRRIRQAAHTHAEHLRKKKESLVRPEDWEESERQIERIAEELAGLQHRRQERLSRRSWVQRCLDAMVLVGKLREQETLLSALAVPSGLPATFSRDLREVLAGIQGTEREAQRLSQELTSIREKQAAGTPNQKVLSNASAIRKIQAHLGVYEKDKLALAKKQAEAASLRTKIQRMRSDLGLSGPEHLLPALRITKIELAEAQSRAETLREASDGTEVLKNRLSELDRDLQERGTREETVDEKRLARLKALRDRASAMAGTADHFHARRDALESRRQLLEELHLELTDAPSDHRGTAELTVPPKAAIENFRTRWEESERALGTTRRTIKELRQNVLTLEAEIESLQRSRDIPHPDDLAVARDVRDRAWQLVLNDWKGKRQQSAAEPQIFDKPLEEAYPESVRAADHIADRLRSEATAVAQLEEKRVQATALHKKLHLEEDFENSLSEQNEALKKEWQQIWMAAALEPRSPSEMLHWRDTWQDFRRSWQLYEKEVDSVEQDSRLLAELKADIQESLACEGEYHDLRHRLDDEVSRMEEDKNDKLANQKLAQATRLEIDGIREKLESRLSQLESAAESWKALTTRFQLPQNLPPALAIEILTGRRELFREADELETLERDCRQLETALQDFANLVRATAVDSGFEGTDIEVLARNLWEQLQKEEKEQQHAAALKERASETNELLQRSMQEMDALKTRLDGLLAVAGVRDSAAAGALATNLDAAGVHQESIAHLRDSLAGLARVESLDTFIDKVLAENADALQGELEDITQELSELEQKLERLHTEKLEAEAKKEPLERAGDEAARYEQLALFEEERMMEDARRFIELQLALNLLRSQLNRFREQNQGPFLSKASHWFAKLTGNAFEGIIASFGDGDEPGIAARRSGARMHEEVNVQGMSEGTRDQLYLALRLAGLELHIQDHPPMPLILDDLLVHFDDHRALCALQALSEMSSNCQILLFTHHRHIVDLAGEHLTTSPPHFHTLGK